MQFTVPEELSTNPEFLRLYAKFLEDTDKLKKNVYELYILEHGKSNNLRDYDNFKKWYKKKSSSDIPNLGAFVAGMRKYNVEAKSVFEMYTEKFSTEISVLDDYKMFTKWHAGNFPGEAIPEINSFLKNIAPHIPGYWKEEKGKSGIKIYSWYSRNDKVVEVIHDVHGKTTGQEFVNSLPYLSPETRNKIAANIDNSLEKITEANNTILAFSEHKDQKRLGDAVEIMMKATKQSLI